MNSQRDCIYRWMIYEWMIYLLFTYQMFCDIKSLFSYHYPRLVYIYHKTSLDIFKVFYGKPLQLDTSLKVDETEFDHISHTESWFTGNYSLHDNATIFAQYYKTSFQAVQYLKTKEDYV